MSRTRLQWGQWMASKGITAFIVEANSRRPLGGHSWYIRNTTEPQQLAEWFDMTENCNYGLWLGEKYVVIDLDVKHAIDGTTGITAFEAICVENGITNFLLEFETLMVKTPSGGYHLYFKTPFKCANKNLFPEQIDVRGAVGYVVGPGSAVENGEYEVLDESMPIMDIPEFLLDYLVTPGRKDPNHEVPLIDLDLDENIAQAIEYLKKVKPAIEGQNGDDHTYDVCCYLRDFGISEAMALKLFHDSGWNAKCEPPWDFGHLEVKIKNSYAFGQNRPGCKAVTYEKIKLMAGRPTGGWGAQITDEQVAAMFGTKRLSLVVDNTPKDPEDAEIPEDVRDDDIDPMAEFASEEQLWYGIQDFAAIDKVREYLVKGWLIAHGITALLAKRGTGKGLPIDEPILTPWGWKSIKDLKVGDMICSPDGNKTEVTGVYPQGVRQCYEFTFQDGSKARCDDQHLWTLRVANPTSGSPIKDVVWPMERVLKEFRNNTHKLSIPTIDGHLARAGCSVRPDMCAYTLGLLLGDGSFKYREVEYTTVDVQLRDHMLEMGFTVKNISNKDIFQLRLPHPQHENNKVYESFKGLGLLGRGSKNKFIPEMFFNASYDVRLNLLQGLMDTDGCVSGSGASFCSISEKLAKGVQTLAWSLGARASINRYPSFCNGERKQDHYTVYIQAGNKFQPFRLQRKMDNLIPYMHKNLWRRVADIKEISPQETMCISVDNPKGLFITRDYVVTHNSTIALDLACHLAKDMDWWGIDMMKNWKVIYICGEDDEGMILNVRAWAKYNNRGLPDNNRFLVAKDIIKMTNKTELSVRLREMREWADGARCLIILDTWARATSGHSSNTQEEMDVAYENAEMVAAALRGPMIACFHPPKDGRMTIRGSAVQEDASSGIWVLEDSPDGSIRLTIERAKGKGKGNYRLFRIETIKLPGEDDYGDSLEGIVPVKHGGTEDEGKTDYIERRMNQRRAWAKAVIGCLTDYPLQNPEVEKTANNITAISNFLTNMWLNRNNDFDAAGFVGEWMDLIDEEDQMVAVTTENQNQQVRVRLDKEFMQSADTQPVVIDNYVLKVEKKEGRKKTYHFVITAASAGHEE